MQGGYNQKLGDTRLVLKLPHIHSTSNLGKVVQGSMPHNCKPRKEPSGGHQEHRVTKKHQNINHYCELYRFISYMGFHFFFYRELYIPGQPIEGNIHRIESDFMMYLLCKGIKGSHDFFINVIISRYSLAKGFRLRHLSLVAD